ncbi:hypothetical protein KI387_005050 [Taxus chinensis]|uniref:Bet v I/Major latex protein domain-containing protein n=1 Tax=Taxus chinensis TaxID=29808 RepID=A0AA38GN10_TAXCH|nr:hypothetical protein KI387_005050 [Taxus chinensis]
MVSRSISFEVETPLEAQRVWNAFVKDGHNLLPKQVPEVPSSITFIQANQDFSFVKELVEEVDEEKFVYRYSHVKGGMFEKTLASAKYEVKYTPKAEGGCVCSYVFHYETLPGVTHEESKVQEIKEKTTSLFKRIEAYLLTNPSLYV